MSNVLQENLQKYHGRISVAKRHALYNKVLSTGELYNPHVHASFAPWQFLKMWNGTTSTMRTPNPEKVITAALRMLKSLRITIQMRTHIKQLRILYMRMR